MSKLKEISNNKCFGGWQKVFSHESSELKCTMNFGVFLPDESKKTPAPVVYWLSGLTCTEANFIQKSGFQKYAAESGLIVVNPDTSPRGEGIPDDEAYDFGVGAGFYVDALKDPWKNNFRMFSYVTKELRELVNENFPVLKEQQSIMGHSMGGHGALICALKNPGMFKSVSAFAPISNPMECEWGKKAFNGYLGSDLELWKDYDACHLVKKYSGSQLEVLIDQGSEDNFLKQKQLNPESFASAAENTDVKVNLRIQDGYDHSYFFISTFIQDHFKHHLKYLKN